MPITKIYVIAGSLAFLKQYITKSMRIAKFIARTGSMSRRDAEKYVMAGKVSVNNEIITNPATKLTGDEEIAINGALLPKIEPTRVWLYHKKPGLITTSFDELGRETIFDDINPDVNHVITIGRLDKNTEGLLVLTNDGEYARQLELPANNYLRTYKVQVFGRIYEDELENLANGITIDGVIYKKVLVKIEKQSMNNAWLQVTLIEGKNREIRNIMQYLGLKIKRLIRIAYGPYQLDNLRLGEVIEVEKKC